MNEMLYRWLTLIKEFFTNKALSLNKNKTSVDNDIESYKIMQENKKSLILQIEQNEKELEELSKEFFENQNDSEILLGLKYKIKSSFKKFIILKNEVEILIKNYKEEDFENVKKIIENIENKHQNYKLINDNEIQKIIREVESDNKILENVNGFNVDNKDTADKKAENDSDKEVKTINDEERSTNVNDEGSNNSIRLSNINERSNNSNKRSKISDKITKILIEANL
ncbi:hypothetical protein HERIO_1068 [Hepatospora eriocheir]|uniref:Uncharacterized protein n=1 Tax=Hepatospora eriocheir TaxID=1081669 RepID=A0A1X0QB50_9MICR|nr:hypothetical protein HERIO_1068 [Hepatospora eriocheir]